MSSIQLSQLEFTLRAVSKVAFPRYMGGAIRGGMGYALRGVVCSHPGRDCRQCDLAPDCAYSLLYESPVPAHAAMMRLYPAAPHPFVVREPLDSRGTYEAGEELGFGVVLVGRAIRHAPALVEAVRELGKGGLGRDRGRLELAAVSAVNDRGEREMVYASDRGCLSAAPATIDLPLHPRERDDCGSRTLTLDLLTPVRIKYNGHLRDHLDFHVLFRSLLRRVSALTHFYCGSQVGADARELIASACQAGALESDLRWVDWPRYSTRQREPMRLGGVVGRVRYARVSAALWPYLRAGEYVHVGKATTFGLGRYRISESRGVA